MDFEYEVDITGVGQAPYGQQDAFGFCSQIAVFHRLKGGCNISLEERDQGETSYTLVSFIKRAVRLFPVCRCSKVCIC